jgi:ubiquinol-cytochrome c reductase cytochrome b subunit
LQAQHQDAGDAAFQKERIKADERATIANRIAKEGVPPEGPLAMMKRDPDLRGPELFDKHCAACHTLGAHGTDKDRTAAKLDGWGTEAWVRGMIHDPDGDARFGRSFYKGEMPSVDMPSPTSPPTFKPMASDDQAAVASFLASSGETTPPRDPSRFAKGKSIVAERCTTCHLFEGELRAEDVDLLATWLHTQARR